VVFLCVSPQGEFKNTTKTNWKERMFKTLYKNVKGGGLKTQANLKTAHKAANQKQRFEEKKTAHRLTKKRTSNNNL
jgi:hypothetical protein